MHLNKLIMRNFKKFRRAEVEFQDGLTGIVGGNGAGKSTIVEAIAWALYGNRASGIKRDYIRNTRAGDSDPVEIRLSLSFGKQELIIYRAMKGKSLMPEAFLLLDGQRIAAGSKEVDQRLEAILKISYQDFMKTFYARQKDLDNLLKEGGTGKREYLLKLLGLDDIKENAVERIKSDRSFLEEQKNRLAGALAEIGDVEAGMEEAAGGILLAERELQEAQRVEFALAEAREKRKQELNAQAEKMRSYELLAEKRSRLELQNIEKSEIIKAEERRLEEVSFSRRQLSDLEPQLERLDAISSSLETLEPKRKEHEEISRHLAAVTASLESERKALQENERRLLSLHKDEAQLVELKVKEKEHGEVQALLHSLEDQRDRYAVLQASLKEEAVRLSAMSANLIRTEAAIQDLLKARVRMEAILPRKEEAMMLERELADMGRQRERQRELEGLSSQKDTLQGRKARLEGEETAARRELNDLVDLDRQEAKLRDQDLELDRLVSDLNVSLADRRGELKVQELAWSGTQANLKKVGALGAKGICPTCERPLEGQRDLLMKKYEQAAAQAEKEIADLQARMKAQMEKIDGAARSRSSLKKAFDDLNAKKSLRSALQSDLSRLGSQISEVESELADIFRRIELLGEVSFDPQRLLQIEDSLRNLAPLVEEYSTLAVRLANLPRLEIEKVALEKEKNDHEGRCRDLDAQIRALCYAESNYTDAKKRLAKLVPLHDRFLLLRDRVLEIPALEEKSSTQQRELNRLVQALQEQRRSLEALGFDPSEHDALQKERKALAHAEEAAQKIRLRLATEPDIRRRLAEAVADLTTLEKDLAAAEEQLKALGYSSEAHEAARQRLAGAETEQEKARKDVSEKKIRLGILKSGLERLQFLSRRKKEHEKALGEVSRRLEVVDTARGLVNMFMDQVLIRVKNEIARTAGEILEEVSGKYSLLKIDDDFNILVEDGGEYYPISRYSGGEIDMIAVSVRVAISEYLMRFGPDGESYSFLIMDEVFGSQDLEHREKMIQMLRSLEERFPQIIAISHISDVQGQFDNTLQVVEDEMGNSRLEAL